MILKTVASFCFAAAAATCIATIAAAGEPGVDSVDSSQAFATVEQPRSFGYLLGDLVRQRVLLRSADADVEASTLPELRKVNIWLERRAFRVESAPDGRRWLLVDYQVINAPQALTTVTVPAWTLKSKHGAPLAIAPWTISVGPLTPRSAFATGELGELRPDRAPPFIATAPLRRMTLAWSVASLLVLLAWIAWLYGRNRRETREMPFARALRELKRMDETSARAWQALHRAFDRTAGQVMHAEALAPLFQRAPHLQALRAEIEQFFAESNQRFFGIGVVAESLCVRALCSKLRRIEKENAQ